MEIDRLLPHQLVPFYLMSCYLYYIEDSPVLKDSEFDALTRRLVAEWDHVQHYHKKLLKRSEVGSGFYLKGRYPLRVKSAAIQWVNRT